MTESLTQKYTAKQLFLGAFFAPVLLGVLVSFVFLVKDLSLGSKGDGGVHIRGNKNAQVKLVEYSDFQCPFCARHSPTLKRILSEYGDKVSLEYKHFPLSFHHLAVPAAVASECAAEQGKFWEFHDKIFNNQAQLSQVNLDLWAKQVGVDMDDYLKCLSSNRFQAKITAETTAGGQVGVQGTPTTFVNGTIFVGAVPYEGLKAAIDAALK